MLVVQSILFKKKVESIYCYAKNKQHRVGFILKELSSSLKYPHIGKYGACRFEVIEKSDAGSYRRDSMKFQILGQFPREGKRWQIGEETAKKLEAEGKIEIVDGIVKKAVYPEDELDKKKYEPFWSHLKAEMVGTAQNGKNELNSIMGNSVGFDTVKPTQLIKELLIHFPNNITILDFFAGSGTTAQAVVELNKEDGGNRKFILCTNNENNICEDITYQRIKTVITGKRKDNSKYSDGLNGSLRYFKTDFVENNSTRDQIYFDLTEKCVPMLCVKESTFDLVEKTDSYVIYKDKNDVNYTCIYFDIYHKNYDDFINIIKDIKSLYYQYCMEDLSSYRL